MAEPNELAKSRLHAIAECLDVPVETFFNATTIDRANAFSEMMILCLSLKTLNGQEAALDALRQITTKKNDQSVPDR